jgi:hypothetical protein
MFEINSDYYPFTNSLYDKCNLEQKDLASQYQFKYSTDPVYENNESCFADSSQFGHKQFNSIPSSNIDIESDLRNQNRLLSRCPETRFDPTKLENCKNCENCNSGLPCGCDHCKQTKYDNTLKNCSKDFNLMPDYTRISNSVTLDRELNVDRFYPMQDDLQDANKIQSNSVIGVNTRLLIKDTYKKYAMFH